ncbi:DUF370 domain-containing protein [Clostridiaceae bacterium OttesenSCG-928-D20]|nr:DUF370 domain-containing protein [Clostridiaceae bacterium OttesenSCG-928-D20]
MYINTSKNILIRNPEIIAILDLDNASYSHRTREFLSRAEKEGRVINASDDLPKSAIITDEKIYLTQPNSKVLSKKMGMFEKI